MLVSGQTRNQISFRVVFQNMFQPIREQEKTYCPMGIQAADFFGGVGGGGGKTQAAKANRSPNPVIGKIVDCGVDIRFFIV